MKVQEKNSGTGVKVSRPFVSIKDDGQVVGVQVGAYVGNVALASGIKIDGTARSILLRGLDMLGDILDKKG